MTHLSHRQNSKNDGEKKSHERKKQGGSYIGSISERRDPGMILYYGLICLILVGLMVIFSPGEW